MENTPESPANTGTAQDTTPPQAGPNNFSLSSAVNDHAKSYDGFDPEVHAVMDDGTPKLKADGTYAKKRGRKAGKGEPLPPPESLRQSLEFAPPDPEAEPEAEPERPRLTPEQSARLCANMLFNGAVMVFGPEWEPRDKEESEGIKNAFKDYFDATGGVDLPPGILLVAALGIYAAPRIQHENTKGKLKRAWNFIKSKMGL